MTRFHIVAPVRWIRREAADKTFETTLQTAKKNNSCRPATLLIDSDSRPDTQFLLRGPRLFQSTPPYTTSPLHYFRLFPTKRNPVIRDGQKDVRFAVQVVADRRFGRWQDLHSVQVLRRCVHHDVHLDHWWVGDVRFRQLTLLCLIYSRVLLMSHLL